MGPLKTSLAAAVVALADHAVFAAQNGVDDAGEGIEDDVAESELTERVKQQELDSGAEKGPEVDMEVMDGNAKELGLGSRGEEVLIPESETGVGSLGFMLRAFIGTAVLVLVVSYLMRKNPRIQRLYTWIERKASERLPRLTTKIQAFYGKQGPKLPRSKYSDLHERFQNFAGPREAEKKNNAVKELKLMSLHGTYKPKMQGFPATFRSIVSELRMKSLIAKLPRRWTSNDWLLLYASGIHGYSLQTLYQKAEDRGPFILVIMDQDSHVFGAFVSEPLQCGARVYYGTGETFIFQLEPSFRVHKWSGGDRQFCVSTSEMLAIGGGGHFAIMIDRLLEHGTSEPGSTTFEEYKSLSSKPRFKCIAVEVWGFTLPSTSTAASSSPFAAGR